MIVTLQPSVLYNVAISTPITPPPTITIVLGTSASSSAPVLSMHCFASIPGIGGIAGTDPVAIINLSAFIVSVPPFVVLI